MPPAEDPSIQRWFLADRERGNPASDIRGWSTANTVEPLVDGSAYFPALLAALSRARAGDQVYFADFRGDIEELLDGPGTSVGEVFHELAARGVQVFGLIWRSQPEWLDQSEGENAELVRALSDAGGEVLPDSRAGRAGSHHQKFVVIRCPGRPEFDVAFFGGIDLGRSRHDGVSSPVRMLIDRAYRAGNLVGRDLPRAEPEPGVTGRHAMQMLRTYPARLRRYPFAPPGDRSIARAHRKAFARARRLTYIEDHYLWAPFVAELLVDALRSNADLQVIAVVPRFPDKEGASRWPSLVGREQAITVRRKAAGERFSIYDVENGAGVPVYVHAKAVVIDDVWAMIGSDNLNRRSWTHDSELSRAVLDCAEDERGRHGPRPPGWLRPHSPEQLPRRHRLWAIPVYRFVYDPDGRALRDRVRHRP